MTDAPHQGGLSSGAPTDAAPAAFFDVDNTLLRGASLFHLARGLYRRKFFGMRDIAGMAVKQARFALNGENMRDIAEAQSAALAFIAGHRVEDMRVVGQEVWHEIMADKVWPGTLALTRRHLDAGAQVWLVTATPQEVADVIAEALGLTGALGTLVEEVDGVYTGRLVGGRLHGTAKADAVAALAGREHLDLPRSFAYSDSVHDVPLLTLVGRPCAINPDGGLRAHARAHGWPVREFRRSRRAAQASVPVAVVAGAIAGAAMGASALRRRRDEP